VAPRSDTSEGRAADAGRGHPQGDQRLREAKILIEQWRWEYNTQRPHSSLDYRSPAEVGGEARAAMKSEPKAIEVAVPVASSQAAVENNRVEVHPITPETLS
jgi:hypothetical protein